MGADAAGSGWQDAASVKMDKRRVPGDGVVIGYGKIDGRLTFAASEDYGWAFQPQENYHLLDLYFFRRDGNGSRDLWRGI